LRVNGKLASLVLVSRWRGRAFFSHVVTAKAYTGQGLATALLLRALVRARDAGYAQADLYVTAGSPAADLYRKLGFTEAPSASVEVDLASFLPTFEALPRLVEHYIGQIPRNELDLRRLPSAWTIREHVYHLAGLQAMLSSRLESMAAKPGADITPFDPAATPERDKLFPSLDAAFDAYQSARRQQVELVRRLSPNAWGQEAIHPEYRRYNIGVLLHHLVFHEYWHLYRVEELWLGKTVEPV